MIPWAAFLGPRQGICIIQRSSQLSTASLRVIAVFGVAHRTKQPKAKKTATTKAAISKNQEDAAQTKKLSALDAAAKVLQEAGQPMNCQQMIQAMADKGYWTSPAGKTPAATLYSALMRETKTKGNQARFQNQVRLAEAG